MCLHSESAVRTQEESPRHSFMDVVIELEDLIQRHLSSDWVRAEREPSLLEETRQFRQYRADGLGRVHRSPLRNSRLGARQNRVGGAQLAELLVAQAELSQDLVGVLAKLGLLAFDAHGCP